MKLQEIFSNRELASIILIMLFILGFQFNKQTRTATIDILKAFFTPAIFIVNLLAILYSSVIIYLLYSIRLWEIILLKDSVYWFIGSGFLILFNLNKAKKELSFFKNILQDNLKFTLILEFIVNIHQFSLVTELILLQILVFLAILKIIIRTQKVSTIIGWLFAIFGLSILGLSILDIWLDFKGFANISNLKSFLLPIFLSISFIPFAYFIAVYMNLQQLFVRLGIFLQNKKDLRYAKWRTIFKSRLSLKKLNAISPKINTLYYSSTRQDIRNAI